MGRGNFGGPGPGGHRPPKGGGILGGFLNRTLNSASTAIGVGVGTALGNAAQKVTNQAVENITTDMEVANEEKMMAVDEQKKVNNLPTHCPHCGAPTNGVLVCEYCNCKIVE